MSLFLDCNPGSDTRIGTTLHTSSSKAWASPNIFPSCPAFLTCSSTFPLCPNLHHRSNWPAAPHTRWSRRHGDRHVHPCRNHHHRGLSSGLGCHHCAVLVRLLVWRGLDSGSLAAGRRVRSIDETLAIRSAIDLRHLDLHIRRRRDHASCDHAAWVEDVHHRWSAQLGVFAVNLCFYPEVRSVSFT
jgi:hypothetical protein